MNAFRVNQRVRLVRRRTNKDRDLLREAGYASACPINVPLGTEGTILRIREAVGLTVYSINYDGYPYTRNSLGYQLEPLTDCYQKTSWEAMKETWSPHHDKEHVA